jgi:hypothetical protein
VRRLSSLPPDADILSEHRKSTCRPLLIKLMEEHPSDCVQDHRLQQEEQGLVEEHRCLACSISFPSYQRLQYHRRSCKETARVTIPTTHGASTSVLIRRAEDGTWPCPCPCEGLYKTTDGLKAHLRTTKKKKIEPSKAPPGPALTLTGEQTPETACTGQQSKAGTMNRSSALSKEGDEEDDEREGRGGEGARAGAGAGARAGARARARAGEGERSGAFSHFPQGSQVRAKAPSL